MERERQRYWNGKVGRLVKVHQVRASAANKYYFSAGHHEQKNKKTTGQIKFSAVKIKQWIKLVLRHSLCK